MNILILYIPLPIYWAVYMQQGSRWIFQATRMNGNLGFYTVQPDQMIALNPIFAILTLPLCDYVIYPLLTKIKVKTLLQKMTIGGMLAVVAFIIAAVVEMKIQKHFIGIFWLGENEIGHDVVSLRRHRNRKLIRRSYQRNETL
jgi:solute carrier family 15 (oligopeptide transporter), member 1